MTTEYRQRTQAERDSARGALIGSCSLLLLVVFGVVLGAFPIDNDHGAFLMLSLMFLPLSSWLSVRCLQSPGRGGKVYAVLTLIGVVAILVVHLIELVPLMKTYYLG
jgi:Ca2+/Na+ antiporter